MRSPLLALLLTAALLSGCVVEEPTTDGTPSTADEAQPPAQARADPQEPEEQQVSDGTPAQPHGTPERTDGAITTGTDPQSYPGAWARQSIRISNGFGPATLGDLQAAIAAGSIVVRAADQAGYVVEATLETRAGTEADAKAILERTHFDHTDVLEGETLSLEDLVRIDPPSGSSSGPAPIPLPPGLIRVDGNTDSVRVDLVITVPLAPAIDLAASASSGDITVSDLHGPALDLSTSSGDIGVALAQVVDVALSASSGDLAIEDLVADTLKASTSSGEIFGKALAVRKVAVGTSSGGATLQGTMDDIEADSSSGDLSIDATPAASGTYSFGASSGEVVVKLGAAAAYYVEAGTSSGDISVRVPDGEVIEDEEDHVEVASPGYDDAELRTAIKTSTSSGDITVSAD